MVTADAPRLVYIGQLIQSLFDKHAADAQLVPTAPVAAGERSHLLEGLSAVLSDCQQMELPKTEAVLKATIHDYEAEMGQTCGQLSRALQYIGGVFRRELSEHIFVQIERDRVPYMKTAEEFAKEPLFGRAVADNFGSAATDIRLAGLSYATVGGTACVFFCMRVLEHGLRVLATDLIQQAPSVSFDFQQWHTIIESIEKEIRKLEALPAGQVKSEKLKFYSQVAAQFFYFKNAWRNHVAHSRESYDSDEGKVVFDHVKAFMQYLTEGGLHE